jgi:hypothetical protein
MSRFFLYAVEAPSADDFYDGASEGEVLTHVARLAGMPHVVRTAATAQLFKKALREGLPESMAEQVGLFPILHISGHGTVDANDKFIGISFSDGSHLPWSDLRELLIPLNAALSKSLTLCMSTCGGFKAEEMAHPFEGVPPYFALIGHEGCPHWADTAVAYACLYRLLAKGVPPREAVAAMGAGTLDNGWKVTTTRDLDEHAYKEMVARIRFKDAVQALRDAGLLKQ